VASTTILLYYWENDYYNVGIVIAYVLKVKIKYFKEDMK
jgi:hypothetical protein